jgi:ribonuclease P protein component
MTDYAEENLSAEQPSPCKDPRVQGPHGQQERAPSLEEAAGQRPQAANPCPLLKKPQGFPKKARLRSSSEFRSVYNGGRRFDGHLMTAFVFRNSFDSHRLGITASRKLARSAVKRNRAKRLLREAFRSSGVHLTELQHSYDWVLNAKRGLLAVKARDPHKEFCEIVARVKRDERESA